MVRTGVIGGSLGYRFLRWISRLSLDGFEHYADPEAVLKTMRQLI